MDCLACGGIGFVDTGRGFAPCRRCRPSAGQKPIAYDPVLLADQAVVFVEMLAAIPYFSGEAGARLAICDELRSLCRGVKEAEWLVTRMRRLYSRWPGPQEMRRVYASKFLPWDGVMPVGVSEVYPDGIPSERETSGAGQIAGPTLKLLPNGNKHEVVEDPENAATIARTAARMRTVRPWRGDAGRGAETLRETITAPRDRPEVPGPAPQWITQADVDAAVRKLREQKALRDEGASD